MKKITLAFLPGAAPTCIPHGIASLAGFLKQTRPGVDVTTVDLSIGIWTRLLHQDSMGRRLAAFFHGDEDDFFNEGVYSDAWERFAPYQQRWQELTITITEALMARTSRVDDWYEAAVFEQLPMTVPESVSTSMQNPAMR